MVYVYNGRWEREGRMVDRDVKNNLKLSNSFSLFSFLPFFFTLEPK